MTARPRVFDGPLPDTTRAAIAKCVRAGLEGLRALPPMRLGDWAQQHFVLAGESSHQRGGWEAWPFQVGILDWMGDDDIYELDVLKSKRVGYTKMLTASIGFDAAYRRRNQALWQPTDDDRDSFVKSEIDPMIEGVPAVAKARRMTKGAEDTIKLKQFKGCVAHMLGGKAARAYRRITVAAVKLDELSGFDQQIEKSADPFTLAEGRLEGAPFPKAICGSTPRIKGLDHTEHRALMADVYMRYRIACPKCGVEHPLEFGSRKQSWGFKWASGDRDSVRHVCPHCHAGITQAEYLVNWVGTWVCDKTGARYGTDRVWRDDRGQPMKPPRHVAVHVWSAYSPQRDWPDIVKQFLAAHEKQKAGDNGPMQGFVNETEGRTWEEEYEQTEADVLRKRARDGGVPMGVVPRGACLVTASIDVQLDRWEYAAWATGRGEETWVVDYRVVYGDTSLLAEWDKHVAPLIDLRYRHASGAELPLSNLTIDTGFQTHQAYAFVRKHQANRVKVYAGKGETEPGKPIKYRRALMDVKETGRKVRRGVALWHIGTDTAKDLIHGRLQIEKPGPGYVHFACDLPDMFFSGITAEKRIPVQTKSGRELRWVCPPGKRNEPLDTAVYCLFGFEMLELRKYTDSMWQRLEDSLEPDLFSQPIAPPHKTEQPPVHTHAQPPTEAAPLATQTPPAPPPRPPRVVAPPRRGSSLASEEWSSSL